MGLAIFTFCIMFLLIASGGLLLFYREEILQRLQSAISPREKQTSLLDSLQQTGFSLSGVVERFERVLPRSQAEVSVMQQRLIRAGYRKDSALKLLYGAKVLVPLTLCALIMVSGLAHQNALFIYVVALAFGFLAPDFWLSRQISSRQRRIRIGLPDVLDLLVICIEAGLSLDQATARTAAELDTSQPDLCDELSIVVLEQRAGRPRSDAWKHMAERVDVDNVRNLVTMLVQSEQFGTSIAKTLRVHSDTLRTQRIQQVEEMAAKTSIKLVFPLVLFIFPSLFLVTLGPAVITIADTFQTLGKH
jgi:tight adherence protein C